MFKALVVSDVVATSLDTNGRQVGQHVREVVGVWVAVTETSSDVLARGNAQAYMLDSSHYCVVRITLLQVLIFLTRSKVAYAFTPVFA